MLLCRGLKRASVRALARQAGCRRRGIAPGWQTLSGRGRHLISARQGISMLSAAPYQRYQICVPGDQTSSSLFPCHVGGQDPKYLSSAAVLPSPSPVDAHVDIVAPRESLYHHQPQQTHSSHAARPICCLLLTAVERDGGAIRRSCSPGGSPMRYHLAGPF